MTTLDLLKRPDASILNEAIPVFFIGRNADGLWVARNADGSSGGIFLFKASAVRFAKRAPLPIPPVTIVVPERFELDVENRGNRHAGQLTALSRKLRTAKARAASLAWNGHARRPQAGESAGRSPR